MRHNGVIVIESGDKKLLHSSCFFENCTRNNDGGAILFNCTGSIIQRRCCSLNVSTTKKRSLGLFCYTNLLDANPNLNTVYECSVCLCNSEVASGTIGLDKGKISISYSNISRNTVHEVSGAGSGSAYETGIINYSTFENNHAKDLACLANSNSNYHYCCCNVIDNTFFGKLSGIFGIRDGTLTVQNCTIREASESHPTFIPLEDNAEFVFINCNIDNFNPTDYEKLRTENISSADKYTILNHLSTHKCDAILPLKAEIQENKLDTVEFSLFPFIFCITYKFLVKY